MFHSAGKEERAEGNGAGRIMAVELKKIYMGYPFVECRSECFCGSNYLNGIFLFKNNTIVKKCIRQKRMDMI
jgi:hypothetical protein